MQNHFRNLSLTAPLLFLMASVPAHAEFSSAEGVSLSGNYLAGRSADRGRDDEIAARYLSQALLEDPGNPVLIEKLFELELASGNVPAAEELARKVVGSNSEHRMARIVLGLRDFRKARLQAVRAHTASRERNPTPVGERALT